MRSPWKGDAAPAAAERRSAPLEQQHESGPTIGRNDSVRPGGS